MKRGQAALEFLLTYGWAILAVIAVLLALSYFGVIDMSKFTTKTCLASGGISCRGGAMISGTEIVFTATNILGYPITLQNSSTIIPTTCNRVVFCQSGNMTCTDNNRTIFSNQEFTARLNCTFSRVYKGTFYLDFINPSSGLTDRATITVSTKR